MKGIKILFAAVLVLIASALMSTAAFAMVYGVSEDNPYVVTSGKGLVDAVKNNMDYYIKLGSDIEINSETGELVPTYYKHVNLDGHTITVTNDQFINMYTNGSPKPKNFQIYNGKIVIDVPKNKFTPCMIYSNMGHIIFRDITMDVTLRNDDSVVFYNANESGSVVNDSLELYNCTINDRSTTKTKVIKARPMLIMENTAITCDNHNSYALIIMHKARNFDMIDCRLKGRIGFDVYNPKNENVNTYIEDWQDATKEGRNIIGPDVNTSVVYKEDIVYGDYIAKTYPSIVSIPDEINADCGSNLSVRLSYLHAKTCEWHLAREFGGVYTEIPKEDWQQDIIISSSTEELPYHVSTLRVSNAGAWLDGYWLCATVSDGKYEKTTAWKQININKRTLSSITVYDLKPPTQGTSPEYKMSFDKSVAPCIKSYAAGYYYSPSDETSFVTNPKAGQTIYAIFDIRLKSDYAEYAKNNSGDHTAKLNWHGVDKSDLTEVYSYVDSEQLLLIYAYTVPVPNGGAGERLKKVNTGVDLPEAGEELSTAAWNTGAYVPKGYHVREVEWTQTDSGDLAAVFTIDAYIGYFIDEETQFFLNDTAVVPDKINDSGTAGNSAVVSLIISKTGDINADGVVDDADAALLLKHLSEAGPLTGLMLERADITEDGETDMLDAVTMLCS